MTKDLPKTILPPAIRMVSIVNVPNGQLPSPSVNVLITNKNIAEHVIRTLSNSPIQKRTNALVQPSRLVNVMNLHSALGESGCIARKTAVWVLEQKQEHVLHLEMLHVQLLEAAINLPLVFTKNNLARFKNAVSLEPLICFVLMFASFSDPNVSNLAYL